jgi:hypothetical protein
MLGDIQGCGNRGGGIEPQTMEQDIDFSIKKLS